MRYIDADTLCKRLDDYTSYDDNWDIEDLSSDLVFITIKEQPTADVKEVVHAEWDDKGIIKDYPSQGIDKYHILICSKCGNIHRQRMWCCDNKPINSNFCPNCGATMDLKAGATSD